MTAYICMIAKVILFNHVTNLVENLKFGGFKAQVNYYTIALLGDFHLNIRCLMSKYGANQSISPDCQLLLRKLPLSVWEHFMTPEVKGINITQWCKEECWKFLKERYKNNDSRLESSN